MSSSRKLRIVHVRPAAGGIADYASIIQEIYRLQGCQITPLVAEPETDLAEAAAELRQSDADLLHFEIGAGDSRLFQLSRTVLRQRPRLPQLLTIHDPGVVIWHPFNVPGTGSAARLPRSVTKAVRLGLNRTLGRRLIQQHLSQPLVTPLYLRPDLAHPPASYYLPQPTYHHDRPKPRPASQTPRRLGFSGYWDPSKGVDLLLEAWQSVRPPKDCKLVIAGSTGDPRDPYAQRLRQSIAAAGPSVELAGFIPAGKLDDFLSGLSALVLPYRPEVPNGTSAMAMRAAELATPIIASDLPPLRVQLGNDGAVYVPPNNAAGLTRAIQSLLDDPAAASDRAQRTQAAIFKRHNWKIVGEQLQTIIEAVAGGQA